MKNLEIKARYPSHEIALKTIEAINAKYKGQLIQKDIYYRVPEGKLKLRSINSKQHELIYYHRAEISKARYSNYELIRINQPQKLDNILSKTPGRSVVVEKKRELYIYQNVRIHLDTVGSLGKFLEFEIVCKTRKHELQAPEKMKFLINIFGIRKKDLIAKSYSDLMIIKCKKRSK